MTSERPHVLCHLLTVVHGESGELLDFVEIHDFDLPSFCAQFAVPIESDPEMLERYAIGPDDVAFLNGVIGRELNFEFSRFGYFIEAAKKDA